MILNRRIMRTILNSTETTDKTKDVNDDNLSFVFTTGDFFYLGFHKKFASRYFTMATVNTNAATLSVEYWNGQVWTSVTDVIDQTSGMTKSGFISWLNESDWQTMEQSPVISTNGEDLKLYWIRISTDTNFSAGTAISAILNLFSDDESVRALYPKIITDSRFKPSGRTDFLEQHIEAKKRVVRRLIQKRKITDESEIIDINLVSDAAAHAFADIILSPIATSEDLITLLQRARDDFESELSNTILAFDINQDGKISKAEERIDSGRLVRR